jgi:hypothetical protein
MTEFSQSIGAVIVDGESTKPRTIGSKRDSGLHLVPHVPILD